VKSFHALPHFTGKAWQGGAKWPDAKLGWVQLTAEGGHPGNDTAHACIRRWIAPRAGTVAITGDLVHEPEEGDGVRAFIVSSRRGELKTISLHHAHAAMAVESIEVQAGDTLDFIVDLAASLNSNQFLWSPKITLQDAAPATVWDARQEFAGPTPLALQPLAPWAQYAQVLLLANEFSFVD
jgi:hypothetical protein